VTFIETARFTQDLQELAVPDNLYRLFQIELIFNPNKGDIIEGSGGIRKVRMRLPGKGKSGSARVWYL
jgi:hypothetical protein